ncbi:MAG: helix-turn-helix domain-containing protein [Clostridia bacterium]|nr:helix-turn-helix domain-containing protein [Clostridia bacterium]
MFNRMFQSVIHQMKDAVGRMIGIIDKNDIVVACSDLQHIGEVRQGIREELSFKPEGLVSGGATYRGVPGASKLDLIVFVEGTDKCSEQAAAILAISIGNMKNLYDQKYDKGSFIKNVMLDNILPSDIYVKSKELRFNTEEKRVVFILKFHSKPDQFPFEVVQGMFPDKAHDYVINIGEQDVVLVKELSDGADQESVEQLALSTIKTLNAESFTNVTVGISSIVNNIKDLARAYKEARIALEVGKVFDTDRNPISYENLGIGRLIYQLPTTLCDIFLQEVFRKGSLDSLDQETLDTVKAFFENNLNVSETSRKLFVHRNTLVYRLEKIRKLTGLDLREFDHAVTFKVALMVKKYLTSKPTKF